MSGCDHRRFNARVAVTRLTETEDGPVIGYTAEVGIVCADCSTAFRFVGMGGGVSRWEPRCSADATEARLPITPFSEAEFKLPAQPIGGRA